MSNYLTHLHQVYSPQTFSRKIAYLKHNLADLLGKNMEVLEVGPGMGELESFLNDQNINSIDILDNDKSVLDFIKEKFKIRDQYFAENLVRVDKQLKQYDLIVMIQVLEHIALSQHKETLEVLTKHLKPGGKLIIVVPNGGNPLSIVERYSDIQHTCIFTEQSLKDLVHSLNRDDLTTEVRGFEIPPSTLLNILRRFCQKILHLFLKLLLVINGGVFFNVMTPNIALVVRKRLA